MLYRFVRNRFTDTGWLLVVAAILSVLVIQSPAVYAQEEMVDTDDSVALEPLDRIALRELIDPAVVRVVQHVTGNVEVVPLELDLVNLDIIELTDGSEWQEVPVDKFMLGNGVVISPEGHVLVNAHLTSSTGLYLAVSSPIAEALFSDTLDSLSGDELDELSSTDTLSDSAAQFGADIVDIIGKKSKFYTPWNIQIIQPSQTGNDLFSLSQNGIPAQKLYVNDRFYDDYEDYAIIESDIGPEARSLPLAELGSSTDVFVVIYPKLVNDDTSDIYDGELVMGTVRTDFYNEDAPNIYYVEMEKPVDAATMLGPLFNSTGEVVGMVVRPEVTGLDADNIVSVVHTASIAKKLEENRVNGFRSSEYRAAYLSAIAQGDYELASELAGGTDTDGTQTDVEVPAGDQPEDVDPGSVVAVQPEDDSDSGFSWQGFFDSIKKPFASFAVTIDSSTETNPLTLVIIFAAAILAGVLLVVILWVFMKLRRYRLAREERMKHGEKADVIPSSEFSAQTQQNSPAQQRFVKEGVRTMDRDTNVAEPLKKPAMPEPTKQKTEPKGEINIVEQRGPEAAEVATESKAAGQPSTKESVKISDVSGEDAEKLASMWPGKFGDTAEKPVPEAKESQSGEASPAYEEVIAYVKDAMKNGFAEKDITQALKEVGWRTEDIVHSFTLARSKQ